VSRPVFSSRGLAQIDAGLARAPELTQRLLLGTMTEATMLLEREVKEEVPRGATGLTAASITSDAWVVPAGVLGVVGSSQPALGFVELGTKPHMPPVKALIPWVRAVLGLSAKEAPSVAFLIARKIAKRGTKPQRPLQRVLLRNEAAIVRMFENTAEEITRQVVAGSA
jgi:hypothetical protein